MGYVPNVYLDDPDFTLYQGDALETLRTLPDESVHCVVTSPPYWGLRDYGAEGQLGLEPTPDQYVANMVTLFREVRRVLRRDGTCWVNLGDSYWNGGGEKRDGGHGFVDCGKVKLEAAKGSLLQTRASTDFGLKPKDLAGIPWRVAFALQADGWYLRSDIIWSKPNPMPESVTDRPTKAHEYVFMLSRSPRYFWDADAIREEHRYDGRKKLVHDHAVNGSHENYANMGTAQERWPNGGRNARSVWEIATQPYPEAHFATFPEELARRCIAAGTSERGCCPECGAPWEREVERGELVGKDRGGNYNGREVDPLVRVNPGTPGLAYENRTTGWRRSCRCHKLCVPFPPMPCIVLDPFMGSGTVAHVARKLGRRSVGIELNPDYCELAARRMQQLSLLA